MLFQNLVPSPALSIAQFSDIDAFRPVEFVADARSVLVGYDYEAERSVGLSDEIRRRLSA